MVVNEKLVVEKIESSGINLTVVPVLEVVPISFNGLSNLPPFLKEIKNSFLSRLIVTSIHLDKALTTLPPTPCNPPDTLYPDSSNLPPA